MNIFLNIDITFQSMAGLNCVTDKQCHVTLFAHIWHVEGPSLCFLTSYHYHEIYLY